MSLFRKPTKFEWLGMVFLTAVLVWWMITGSDVARCWVFAVVAMLFVGRVFIKW